MEDKSETAPRRIQLSRRKGWRMPPNTVSVGRPGRFGNPFSAAELGRERAVDRYARWICSPEQAALVADARENLRGKNLACWCKPGEPCHAGILLRLVNEP